MSTPTVIELRRHGETPLSLEQWIALARHRRDPVLARLTRTGTCDAGSRPHGMGPRTAIH